MTTLAGPEAVAREAHQRLIQLREQETRLSLDAFADETARARLADVEGEIEVAERELRRAALAENERERRDQEAKARAERERIDKAVTSADKLAARRLVTKRRVDEAALRFAEAVREDRRLADGERSLRVNAGELRSTATLGQPYDAALRHALAAMGAGNLLELAPGPPRQMCPDDAEQTEPSERS